MPQNPTNPALENAYSLAKEKGYNKDINAFTELISTDDNALNSIYTEVKSKGYSKDIESFKSLLGLKKKESSESTPTDQNVVSEVQDTNGSLVTQEIPTETKLDLKDKYTLDNRQNFTAQEWKQAQELGYAPPDSKIIANSNFNVSLEDMTLPPDEQRKKLEEVSQPIKEELSKPKTTETQDFGDGVLTKSFIPTEEDINTTKTSASRIKEAKDLNIEHPFRYYSDLKVGETNAFIENTYGSEKLKNLGIDVSDFEGFLKEKGYKEDYINREERGLFEGGTGTGANTELSKELEQFKMLSLYLSEKDKRANLKQKYDAQEQLGYETTKEPTPVTLFDSEKLKTFVANEFPVMTQELKQRDEKSKEIYQKHINGEAGLLYGTGQVLTKGWYGIEDRINNLSATLYDTVGMDNVADNIRYAVDQTKLTRPNTREVVFVSGNEANHNDRTYIVDSKNRIIDKELKLDVTDMVDNPKAIIDKSKSGNSTNVFSTQGALMQTGNVVGDLLVQIGAQASIGRLGINPVASSVIAQSALGYSSGFEDAYKDARSLGVTDNESKDIAKDIGREMGIWYGLTSVISPQTKATQAIFGSEKTNLINSAINAYKEGGKKALNNYLSNTKKKFANKAVTFLEEGSKEAVQENIQQLGELPINKRFNENVGSDLRETEFNKDDFINTTILSFVAGGLPSMIDIGGNRVSSVDRLEALKLLSDNGNTDIDKIVAPLIENGTLKPNEATELLSDLAAYKNQRNSIPQNLNPEVALSVMHDLEKVKQLEAKKKNLDRSFHADIDEDLNTLRTSISETVEFSKLGENVIQNYKDKATESLKSDTTTLTDKQITEKAIALYAEENTTQETQEETQPTVETTTPETEVESQQGIEDTPSPTVELNPENTSKTEDSKLTEKQEEDAEWQSVLGKPLSEIENRLNELEQQEKDVSEGKVEFGPFAEPREIRSTRAVVKKYQSEVSKEDAKRDFKDAFFGNPESYLSDGLKLRESVRVFIEQGGTFKELLSSVKNEFIQDGFSEQDAANVINRKLNAVKSRGLNETQAQGNTATDGNLQPRVEPSDQQGQGDNTQSTVNNRTSKSTPKTYKLADTDKAPEYQVNFKNGVLDITDSTGNTPSKPTMRKVRDKYANDLDFTQGEKAVVPEGANVSPNEIVAKASNNPSEVAELLSTINTKDHIENNIDYKKRILADNVLNVEKQSYINFGDANNITNGMARSYFSTKGEGSSLDTLAEELTEDYGITITEQDIVEHMEYYPNGKNDVYKEFRDSEIVPLQQRFTELTGLPANDKYITQAVNQAIAKEQLNQKLENDYLNDLTNEELVSLEQEQIGYEKSRQQETTPNSSNASKSKAKNTSQGKGKSRVREGTDTTDGSTEQASQSRVKALTNERIKPVKRKPKGKPKKLSTIIKNVSKDLKATLIYGKSRRRNSAGTYSPSNALVRIRNANDLDTVAHELGHLLDDRHDILGPIKGHKDEIKLVRQLQWFSERGGSNPPKGLSKAKQSEYLEREGLAEFIRAYVVNPTGAKAIAPELYSYFESTIDNKTKTVLKTFSDDVLDYENATYGEKIDANIEDSNLKEKKGFKDWLNQFKSEDGKLNIHFLDKVKSNWTNSLHVANKAYRFGIELRGKSIKDLKPEDNFEVISRLLAGINGKINALFNNGLTDAKNKVIKDSQGKKFTINYLLEPLDNTSEATVQQEMRDVITLLVAERTVEYAKKFDRNNDLTGIGGGLQSDLDIAVGHLNEVKELKKNNKEKYDRIKEAARRYREFADAGLQYAVEKGRISKEQYDRIKETNEYYVSLARTKEVTPGDELLPFLNDSNKITSVKEVIKKATGGTDTIKDPYLSLLENTVNFIKESDRNEVMNSFIEPFRNVREMGDGTPIDLSQIARQMTSSGPNTKKVFNNGNLEYWQFDQDIHDSLVGLESVSHNPIINAIALPSSLIRFTVTNFPVFAARNAVRDTMSRLVISRTNGTLGDLLHNKDDRMAFETYGGSQAGFYLQNKDAYVDEMKSAVKKLTKKGGVILDPRKLNYNGYRKFLERGENLNRIAEYKSAFKKAKKEGMDDYNAGLYAAFQARDLMDFAVAGHYMRTINKLIPFSNASVQSVKRTIKGAKENPAQFAVRMALYTLIPQMIVRALVAAGGDEEEYEELPDYQRDLFWNFKTPMTGDKWISIPKPFELGLPSSFVDRGYSYSQGKKEALEGFAYSSYNTLNPFDAFSLTGPFKPIVEATSNYDSFRERDIVPFWEKDKLMELMDGTKYASRVGNYLSDAFGFVGAEVDPRKIDHVVKGYTTYFGNTLLSLGDIGNKDSYNQFNFTKTGFMKDVPVSTSKSVKKAYKLAESIGMESDKNVKTLKAMVKAYYDTEDKSDRKKIKEYIYTYSKDVLIPYLEESKKLKLANKN